MSVPVVVLKLGSSVLPRLDAIPAAATEIAGHVRAGCRVVAVVSAIGEATDHLIAAARELELPADAHERAAFVRSGDVLAARVLAAGLARIGIAARLLDGAEPGIRASGPVDDATIHAVEPLEVERTLAAGRVAVVPGFGAVDDRGRCVLLGRGGSDLVAVALGAALGARTSLLKDTEGVLERDPAVPGPPPRRYERLAWEDAVRSVRQVVQPRAVEHARAHGHAFHVTAPGAFRGTVVGPGPSRLAARATTGAAAPRRVALAGLGTVGGGVARRLLEWPGRWTPVAALVRDPGRTRADLGAAASIPRVRDVAALLAPRPDVVVEAIGGVDDAAVLVRAALEAGADVVTANKRLVAERGEELLALAAARGRRLRFSASVGGGVPVLETIARVAAEEPVVAVEGVLNGASNAIVKRLAAGASPDAAIEEARRLGLAEADPSEDLEGLDAARKLAIVARTAFGLALPVDAVRRETVTARRIARFGRGADVVPLARVALGPDGLDASVRLVLARDPLFRELAGAGNAVRIRTASGRVHAVRGLGAGRWPTTESVLADLEDLRREDAARSGAEDRRDRAAVASASGHPPPVHDAIGRPPAHAALVPDR